MWFSGWNAFAIFLACAEAVRVPTRGEIEEFQHPLMLDSAILQPSLLANNHFDLLINTGYEVPAPNPSAHDKDLTVVSCLERALI